MGSTTKLAGAEFGWSPCALPHLGSTLHPGCNRYPTRGTISKGMIIFQPSNFRGYVSSSFGKKVENPTQTFMCHDCILGGGGRSTHYGGEIGNLHPRKSHKSSLFSRDLFKKESAYYIMK